VKFKYSQIYSIQNVKGLNYLLLSHDKFDLSHVVVECKSSTTVFFLIFWRSYISEQVKNDVELVRYVHRYGPARLECGH
jgi:hypothetical protein